MGFFVTITILTLVALFVTLLPLFKKTTPQKQSFNNDESYYQARLKEIERDLEMGILDEESAQIAKTLEARKLIKASKIEQQSQNQTQSNRTPFLLACLILVPVFTLGLYFKTGSPPPLDAPLFAEENSDVTMEELVAAAEKRLKEHPDDLEGWKTLAPIYSRLGRYDDAINAYENALRIDGRKPVYTYSLAETIMSKHNGKITDESLALFKETYELAPANPLPQYYFGLHLMQKDKIEDAIAMWKKLLAEAKGDEFWVQEVQVRISQAKEILRQDQQSPENSEAADAIKSLDKDDQLAAINQMVAGLEEKLKDEPNNKKGWRRLIRSYMVLKKQQKFETAIETAQNLFASDEEFTTWIEEMKQEMAKAPAADGANQ